MKAKRAVQNYFIAFMLSGLKWDWRRRNPVVKEVGRSLCTLVSSMEKEEQVARNWPCWCQGRPHQSQHWAVGRATKLMVVLMYI